jgi:hypothetical protein
MKSLIIAVVGMACWLALSIDPDGTICIAGKSQSGTWELQIPRAAIEHGQSIGVSARYEATLIVMNEDGSILAQKPVFLMKSWKVRTTGQYGLTIALNSDAIMDVRSDTNPAGYVAALATQLGLTLSAQAVIAPVHEWEPEKTLIQPKSWGLAKKLI